MVLAIAPDAPASAAEPLADRLCLLHTGLDTGLAEALARRGECRTGAVSIEGPRVWAFADIADIAATPEALDLVGDPSDFDALGVYTRTADGQWAGRRYYSRVASENWRADSRFAIGLGEAAIPRTDIALAFDRPALPTNISNLSLSTPAEGAEQHYRTSLFYALFVGLMLVPIFYNLAFYTVMREHFMLWHVGMAAGALGYALFSGGTIYLLFPDLPLTLRWHLNLWSITLGITSMAMFCRTFLERDMLRPIVRWLLAATTVPFVATTIALTTVGEPLRPIGNQLYLLSFVPVLAIFIFAIGSALSRGSRAARFQAVAWSALLASGGERIVRGLGLYHGSDSLQFLVFFALAFEVVVTAIGVADRIMTIQRQRDRAREREIVFAQLAETDELTGLLDRRGIVAAFDSETGEGGASALAIIDLDHFKQVNDRHGHEIGDQVLRAVGALLGGWSDITAGRLGGEEFVVFIHGAKPEATAERLQRAITIQIANTVPLVDRAITASIGLVRLKAGQRFVDAYRASDKYLYAAKNAGRNRTIHAGNALAEARLRKSAA